jgi:hypothetical protein
LFVGDGIRNEMEIFERQRQIFGERTVVIHDAKDGAARTMSFEATAAKCADRPIVVRGTGNVDFAGNAFAEPFRFFFCGKAINGGDFADEFVAGNSAKGVIAAKDLHVGVADAGEENAHERPAGTELRERLVSSDEFFISNREGQHGMFCALMFSVLCLF